MSPVPNVTAKIPEKAWGGTQMFQESVQQCIWLHSLNRLRVIKPKYWSRSLTDFMPFTEIWGENSLGLFWDIYFMAHGCKHHMPLNKTFCVICNPFANNFPLSTNLFHCSHKAQETLKSLFPGKLKAWLFVITLLLTGCFVFNMTL